MEFNGINLISIVYLDTSVYLPDSLCVSVNEVEALQYVLEIEPIDQLEEQPNIKKIILDISSVSGFNK